MFTMADNFERITIRLKPYEQKIFKNLMDSLRDRAGYDIPATDVVKSLMGFKTKLSLITKEDQRYVSGAIDFVAKGEHGPVDTDRLPTSSSNIEFKNPIRKKKRN